MYPRFRSVVEPLESRIAPAAVVHPLPDIVAGVGQTGAVVDLSKLLDFTATGEHANRTLITIQTSFDADPNTAGIQGDITIELFDDLTPLTVQNFLRYALNQNANGDYDGTFFHRLAQGFVLQGGGFQLDGTTVEHIDSLAPVHNEFDPSRSNVRGTIALAKTGLGPNTGTSEWFINLADNGGNLDNQNGGFTVFGRVIDKPGVVDGMEVVDKIAQSYTVNSIVSGFPTPLQNYDADPDDNPQTPAPAIDPSNLITIKDVVVNTPVKGTTSASSIESVTVISGSDLVEATRNGTDLVLKYAPGKTGVAEVSVKVAGVEEPQTFFVTVQPNLITSFTANKLPGALVPGDSAEVKLNLTNTGGGLADGEVEVKFYFAKATQVGPGQYQPVLPLVKLEANTETVSVKIGSGETMALKLPVNVPSELVSNQDTIYQLYAEIVPKSGTVTGELFSDDNTTLEAGGVHQIYNAFGNVGDKNKTLTYKDADGDEVRLSLKGKGYGQLFLQADGTVDVVLNGTNAKTKVTAQKTGASVSFGNVEAISAIGSIDFGQLDVSGSMAFPSGIKMLKVGDITGPSTVSIGIIPGAEKTRTSLSFGKVEELSLNSSMPISSLKALTWLDDTGAQDFIITPGLQSLTIGTPKSGSKAAVRGDLEADVYVTGSASVKKFTVTGLLNDASVRIYGDVGNVVLGGIKDSSFLAGTNASDLPQQGDPGEARTIRSFTITGLDTEQFEFSNSILGAVRFMNVNIRGAIDTSSGSEQFGIIADVINKYRSLEKVSTKPLTTPQDFDEQGNYVVKIV